MDNTQNLKEFNLSKFSTFSLVILVVNYFIFSGITKSELLIAINILIMNSLFTTYTLLLVRECGLVLNREKINIAMSKKRWVKYSIISIITKYFSLYLFYSLLSIIFLTTSIKDAVISYLESTPYVEAASPSVTIIVITLLYGCIIGPIWEEIIFRGVIYQRISLKYKRFTAAIFSSLIFAAIHLIGENFFHAFAVGLLMCLVYTRTKNITVCIILHGFINLLAYVYMFMPVETSENPPVFNESSLYTQMYFDIVLCIIFSLLLGIAMKKNKRFIRQYMKDENKLLN